MYYMSCRKFLIYSNYSVQGNNRNQIVVANISKISKQLRSVTSHDLICKQTSDWDIKRCKGAAPAFLGVKGGAGGNVNLITVTQIKYHYTDTPAGQSARRQTGS